MKSFKIKVFNESTNALPVYAKPGDSGMDIRAKESFLLNPGETKIVPTGLYVGIPEPGLEIQVRPRSGMSYKTSLRIANSPGTIDSSYLGEIGIIFDNIGAVPLSFAMGERIAQIVLCPVYEIVWNPVDSKNELGSSERGDTGYGSSGTK